MRYSNGAKDGVDIKKYGIVIKDNTPFDEKLPFFKFIDESDDYVKIDFDSNDTEIEDVNLIYGIKDSAVNFDGTYESLQDLDLKGKINLKDYLDGTNDEPILIPIETTDEFTYLYVFLEYIKDGKIRYSNNVKLNKPSSSEFYYNIFPLHESKDKFKNGITMENSSLILDNDNDLMENINTLYGNTVDTNLFKGIKFDKYSGRLKQLVTTFFVNISGILDNVSDDKGVLILHKHRRNLDTVNSNNAHEGYYFKNKEVFKSQLNLQKILIDKHNNFLVFTGMEKGKPTKDTMVLFVEMEIDTSRKIDTLHEIILDGKDGKEFLDLYLKEGKMLTTPLKNLRDRLVIDIDLSKLKSKRWKDDKEELPEKSIGISNNELANSMNNHCKLISNTLGMFCGVDYFNQHIVNNELLPMNFTIGNTFTNIKIEKAISYKFDKVLYLNKHKQDLNTINIVSKDNLREDLKQIDVKKDKEVKMSDVVDLCKLQGEIHIETKPDGNRYFTLNDFDLSDKKVLDDVEIYIKSNLNNSYYHVIDLSFKELDVVQMSIDEINEGEGKSIRVTNSNVSEWYRLADVYDIKDVSDGTGNRKMTEQEFNNLIEEFREETKDSPYEHIFED